MQLFFLSSNYIDRYWNSGNQTIAISEPREQTTRSSLSLSNPLLTAHLGQNQEKTTLSVHIERVLISEKTRTVT